MTSPARETLVGHCIGCRSTDHPRCGGCGSIVARCEQCGDGYATNDEWGPWLCDGCTAWTAMGDGGDA